MVQESEDERAREDDDGSPADGPGPDIRLTTLEREDSGGEDLLHKTTLFCDGGLPVVTPHAAPREAAPADGQPVAAGPESFRPRLRPPMALLLVLDDNQRSAEWIRIRGPQCVLGRAEGDVRIPHELLMSRRHAEIRLQREPQGYRWYLHDLDSANGTFVLAEAVRLKQGDELLIGRRRFRFQPPCDGPGGEAAALLEIVDRGGGRQIELTGEKVLLGRSPDRGPAWLADDPLIDAEHARLYREKATGRWCIQRESLLNGIWARITKVPLRTGCWFQLGEQRFRFLLP